MRMPNQSTSSTIDFERCLTQNWPLADWADTHVVLAVSGGADSVALLRAMAALKSTHGARGELLVVHVNHGLRGEAADADEAWLRELCSRLGVAIEVAKADVAAVAAADGDGWEAAARKARYALLCEAAERQGARFVATAHTADDQVETVLHRILRGTGIEGLSGMPRVRPLTPSVTLVRPMLNLTRRDVIEYLTGLEQDYRSDATNEDHRWTRNRLRSDLLPLLREQYNPGVDAAITRLATQAAEVQQVIAALAAEDAAACVTSGRAVVRIDCSRLRLRSAAIVREVLKAAWRRQHWPEQSMGHAEWKSLAARVLGETTQSLNLPGAIQVRCAGQFVELRAVGAEPDIT